jgi:quinol monooxygenase YgiN
MIIEYIRYKIPGGKKEQFVQAYAEASKELDVSPHCQGYELTQCSEDKEFFTLRILWKSLEAHLEGFRNSPGFRNFFAPIKPFVGDIQEMRHYEFTSIRPKA